MTTPEQLAKWREEAEDAYAGMGFTHGFDDGAKCYESGYLRAKQETEQALKDARRQALEDALAIVKNENKIGDIEFEIKELLK